jgi:hypothetical protein
VNCGPRSNFFYIALLFYFYSHCLLSCILLSYYHLIRSILCLQQTGQIDNLIVSWEQSSWLCCVQVSRCCWERHADKQFIWRPCPECHEASKHHLLKFGFLILVRLNLGFIAEGRLATVLIIPSSWGSQRAVLTSNQAVFWRRCWGLKKKKLPHQLHASKTSEGKASVVGSVVSTTGKVAWTCVSATVMLDPKYQD